MEPFSVASQTFLGKVSPELRRELVDSGRVVNVPAGRLIARKATPGVAIVLEGLIRVFLQSPRQRQVTLRYARPGEALGLVQLFGGRIDVRVEAVTASTFLALSSRRIRALAETSGPLAVAIAEECAARVADTIDEIALLTFGSVQQLVARHLLDLARSDGPDGDLIAPVTQQDLADATGSVRVVVARALKALNDLGLTRRSPRGIVIVEAAGLDEEARRQRC